MAECSIRGNSPQLSWPAGREEILSVKLAEIPDTTLITSMDPNADEDNKKVYMSFFAGHKEVVIYV